MEKGGQRKQPGPTTKEKQSPETLDGMFPWPPSFHEGVTCEFLRGTRRGLLSFTSLLIFFSGTASTRLSHRI